LTHTVISKRKLKRLVESGLVDGWDDPRMPTLSGMRRLGYTPEAIRGFCDRVGVAKRDSVVEVELLEHGLREDLNARCPRVMAVTDPLKVVIENLPEDYEDEFEAQNHPEYPERGTRKIPFSRELYVERSDFMEVPAKKWFRLAPGKEVRLRYACLITCKQVVKDSDGNVVELRCEWDPDSRGGTPRDGRKVKGTLHWVSARHAVRAQVRLYERLFLAQDPEAEEGGDFLDQVNRDSLTVHEHAALEPSLAGVEPGQHFQFERMGYFCVDSSSRPGRLVFNRTIGLRDSWAKISSQAQSAQGKRNSAPSGTKPRASNGTSSPGAE
jgi:glutaminyl-tRNA synthetase